MTAYTNHTLEGLKKLRAHVEAHPVQNGDDLMPLAVKFCIESAGTSEYQGRQVCPPADMAVRYLNRAAPSIKNGLGRLLPRTPGEDALLVIDAAMALAAS